MKQRDGILFSLLLVLFGATLDAKTRFFQRALQVPGQVKNATVLDLNADGLDDVLVFHLQTLFPGEPVQRHLSLFLQTADGLPDQPTRTWPIHPDDILFDVLPDSSRALVFLRRDGLFLRGITDDEPTRLFSAASSFQGRDENRLPRRPLAFDFNRDGCPEFLLPQSWGADLYWHQNRDGYRLRRRLLAPASYQFSDAESAVFQQRLPMPRAMDFNGDGGLDLLMTAENRVMLFHHQSLMSGDSTLSPVEPDTVWVFNTQPAHTGPVDAMAPSSVSIEWHDLNGDGLPDGLISKRPLAGFAGNIHQVQVYMNRQGLLAPFPDQVLTSDNWAGGHFVSDFNGDGRQDIALLHLSIGYGQALRFLLSRKVAQSLAFHLMDDRGGYRQEADWILDFARPLHVQHLMSAPLGCHLNHDFTGDGINDLLILSGHRDLTVYVGKARGLFEKKPGLMIQAPISDYLVLGEFNGDGVSDLLFWHPDDLKKEHLLSLVLSRRGK